MDKEAYELIKEAEQVFGPTPLSQLILRNICPEVCAFCRHWKYGTSDKAVRAEALENLAHRECHVKQPTETRADDTCSMWMEVGTA